MRPDSCAAPLRHSRFGSLRYGSRHPRASSALPPPGSFRRASPKAISGRTSYLRVRLEFLLYPHLLATLFNGCACGPPGSFTAPSSWARVGHPVSGPLRARKSALFRLGLPAAPRFQALSPPHGAARRTVLQKVRGQPRIPESMPGLPQLAGTGFQVLFHSPPGVLFTFPSQYCALSVTEWYLALRGGPRTFPQGSTCPAVLWIPPGAFRASRTGLSPPLARLSRRLPLSLLPLPAVLTPGRMRPGLGSSGFARRYSRNHFCFLFLRLLRCFSSPGCPRRAIFFPLRRPGLPRAGSPIRTPADHRACAPPRSFSQLVASFFGPQCQGIRPAPSFCLSSAAVAG